MEYIIKKLFRRLDKSLRLIKEQYDPEVIHDFRVDVKKLRAFTRLLSAGMGEDGDGLKLPRSLKEIYTATGRIRDLQLQVSRVTDTGKRIPTPNYHQYLLAELEKNKGIFYNLYKAKAYAKARDKVVASLPEHIEDTVITQFYHKKAGYIRSLLSAVELPDADWHSTRKSIKDLLYIFKILKEDFPALHASFYWNDEQFETAGKVAQVLGEFNDVCIALNFLRPSWLIEFMPGERKQLQQLRLRWLSDKRDRKVQLSGELGPLMLRITRPLEQYAR